MQDPTIRIVIADDHEIFREGFKLLLRNQDKIQLVGEADNGRDLLSLIEIENPDIVITDIKMPQMDGIEVCREVGKLFPQTHVIALSMFNDDHLIIDMLKAGAKGYLLKNTNKDELLLAVKTVHEGKTYYSAATSHKLAKLIGSSSYNPLRQSKLPQFTSREKEIIQLICEQFTSKEIGSRLNISVRTVESHREKIQEKMEAKNAIGIVIYAIRNRMFEM